jgi:AcrR family transcriptional regulator
VRLPAQGGALRGQPRGARRGSGRRGKRARAGSPADRRNVQGVRERSAPSEAGAPNVRPQQDRTSTSARLLQAAAEEFNEQGFGGTDTNKIARRAGFAPPTFYRWFKDKDEIFIEVYERWRREQFVDVSALLAEGVSDARLAQAVVAHYKRYRVFRRSLRQLSVENDVIRAARARSRLEQIGYMKTVGAGRDDARLAAILLQMERLADALAEGELRDMGLNEDAAAEALTRLIHDLRTP